MLSYDDIYLSSSCDPLVICIITVMVTIDTGIELRCDVFVDTIHRIEIVTTTRELLLDEAPEVFDVRAFDDEGVCLCLCVSFCVSVSVSVCLCVYHNVICY